MPSDTFLAGVVTGLVVVVVTFAEVEVVDVIVTGLVVMVVTFAEVGVVVVVVVIVAGP